MDRGLLAALLGFFVGTALASFVSLSWYGIALCVLTTLVFAIIYVLRKQFLFVMLSCCLLGVALGSARMLFVPSTLPQAFTPLIGQYATIEGEVVRAPDIRETSQRITLKISSQDATTRVLVVAPLFPEVHFGDTLSVSGAFEEPRPFDVGVNRTFSYDAYLKKDGIFLITRNADIEVVESAHTFSTRILRFFSDIKQWGTDALTRALPEPHASLASGLLLGGKQGLGEGLLNNFILVGLVHIVVLSGYNVMIVAEAVRRFFSFLSKRISLTLAGATVFLFVCIAGAGSASIRAGLMAGIALFARSTGKTYDAFRALLFVAFLMVLVNPYVLAFDIGFQLSCIATLGLLFITPHVEKQLMFIQNAFLREVTATTISAQVAVLPLLLYQNGLLSLVALPVNILVLPLVPLAMLASLVALVAGAIVPVVAPLVSLPAYALLSYVIGVVDIGATLPFAGVTVPAFSPILVFVCYALFAYVFLIRTKRT